MYMQNQFTGQPFNIEMYYNDKNRRMWLGMGQSTLKTKQISHFLLTENS